MDDDLETQIQNSVSPHINLNDDDVTPQPSPAQAAPIDPNAPDPLDEKVFNVSPDFDISEAESAPPIPIAQLSAQTRPQAVPIQRPTPQPYISQVTVPVPPRPIAANPVNPTVTQPAVPPIAAPVIRKPINPMVAKAEADHAYVPQKAIRTYEGDVMDILAHNKVSSTTMAMAENNRKGEGMTIKNSAPTVAESSEPTESTHIVIKLLIAIVSVALIGGGAFGAYYLYSQSPLAPIAPTKLPVETPKTATAIIPSDASVFIPIDNLDSEKVRKLIIAEINKDQKANTIKEIIPTITSATGGTTRVGGPYMLKVADVAAPDMLARSLTDPWMLGSYVGPSGEKGVFIVATTNFFQGAFAGMLQWEGAMAENFRPFLRPEDIISTNIITTAPPAPMNPADLLAKFNASLPTTTPSVAPATSTTKKAPVRKNGSTSLGEIAGAKQPTIAPTPSPSVAIGSSFTASSSQAETPTAFVSSFKPILGAFSDRIIKNKDVREFKTTDGKVLFLYSFIDNNHIVLATSEAVLTEALTRVEKQAYVR